MSNLKAEMSRYPPRNLIPIAVFYHLLLVIGYPILLGGFKLGDEVLDQSGLREIFVDNGADGDLRRAPWSKVIIT